MEKRFTSDKDIEITTSFIIDCELKNENKAEALANLEILIEELKEEDLQTSCRLRSIRSSIEKAKKAYYSIKEDSTPVKLGSN